MMNRKVLPLWSYNFLNFDFGETIALLLLPTQNYYEVQNLYNYSTIESNVNLRPFYFIIMNWFLSLHLKWGISNIQGND